MNSAPPPSNESAELRRRAEAQYSAHQPQPSLPANEPETLRLVHELQVHQIELEMQNEELRRTHSEVEIERERYADLYEFAPLGYLTLDWNGTIRQVNLNGTRLLGPERSRLVGTRLGWLLTDSSQLIFNDFLKRVFRPVPNFATQETCEVILGQEKDQNQGVWMASAPTSKSDPGKNAMRMVRIEAIADEDRQTCRAVLIDITELKQAEEQRAVEADLLRICHFASNKLQLIQALADYFQRITGCEAVGVRIHKGDDFPYYETRGFSKAFVKAENLLCARDLQGQLLRDELGHPLLECMCGNILHGRFDPSKPFFTSHGSFWSNDTTELLATTTPSERLARTRNRCNGEGYESVALIPIRSQGKILGLFQFNDRRRGRFSLERIEQYEHLVDYVAIALDNQEAIEALRESEERYRRLTDNALDVIFRYNLAPTLSLAYINPAIETITGYTQQECYADPTLIARMVHPEDAAQMDSLLHAIPPHGEPVRVRWIDKNGGTHWMESRIAAVRDPDGQLMGVEGITRDISEHKRVEDTLLFLAQCAWVTSGEDFFQSLARFLAETLGMDYVCIDRLTGDQLAAQTVAIYCDGQFQDNLTYTLQDTPCSAVVGKTICCFPREVRHLFPEDVVLQEMVAESYLGTTLWGANGQPIGLIAVIGRHPLTNSQLAESILKLAAVRAAGELERKQTETLLNEQLEELRRWYAVTLGRESRVLELKDEINQLLIQAGQPPRYTNV
jgi:PAS domain S-box-containing protein